MSRESKKTLKRGKETEEKEKKQIRIVNRISLAGVIIAGIIFLAASIAAIPTIGYHLACFSAFMVVSIETYEWLIVIYKKKAEKATFHRDKQKYRKIYNYMKNFKGDAFSTGLCRNSSQCIGSIFGRKILGRIYGHYLCSDNIG